MATEKDSARSGATVNSTDRDQTFRTGYEEATVPGFGGDKPPAALMFNPDAPPLSIAAAALARADCLQKTLNTWSAVKDSMVDARDLAEMVEPMANEVQMLLAELVARLPQPGKAAA